MPLRQFLKSLNGIFKVFFLRETSRGSFAGDYICGSLHATLVGCCLPLVSLDFFPFHFSHSH